MFKFDPISYVSPLFGAVKNAITGTVSALGLDRPTEPTATPIAPNTTPAVKQQQIQATADQAAKVSKFDNSLWGTISNTITGLPNAASNNAILGLPKAVIQGTSRAIVNTAKGAQAVLAPTDYSALEGKSNSELWKTVANTFTAPTSRVNTEFESKVYGKPVGADFGFQKAADEDVKPFLETIGFSKETADKYALPLVVAGSILDITPGGGGGKKLAEEGIDIIKNTKNVDEIIPTLKKYLNFSEADATALAPRLVEAGDTAAVQKELKSYITEKIPTKKVITTTTPPPPTASDFDEAMKIANGVKQKTPVIDRLKTGVRNFEQNFLAEYAPARKLEKKVLTAYDTEKPAVNLQKKFELTSGAAGKAEADIARFDESVAKYITGKEKEFNAYLFLERTKDRLLTDPSTRQVGTWTIEKVNKALEEMKDVIGDDTFDTFKNTSSAYQKEMDQALQLQVASGRMPAELYREIKQSNDFYAPFKVMKYIEENATPGTNPIQNMSSLTKAIKGIKDESFSLQDIMQSSKEQIARSRLLAEKNVRMLELDKLAEIDTEKQFVRNVQAGTTKSTKKGYDVVHYYKNGVEKAVEIPEELARVLKSASQKETGIITGMLKAAAKPFRYGATTANMAFQPINLIFADIPRQALISKYGIGINGLKDIYKYPTDFVQGMLSSFSGNFGGGNKLYREFLESGAANSTIQKVLTPEVFNRGAKAAPGKVIDTIAKFSNAIEETSKLIGFKRGLDLEKIAELPAAERAAKMDEIATEIRNYSGSPDFAKSGTETKKLNVMFMFFNARLQGVSSDLARLAGRTGKTAQTNALIRTGAVIGLPALGLALLNNSDEYKEDYAKIHESEKNNYFMIPTDHFFTDADGNKVRDYYRIPKRDLAQIYSSVIEGAVDFAHKKDPKSFGKWADDMLQSMSPINFQGDTITERLQSVASGMNPLIKAPIEYATGKNLFFHSDIVPRSKQNLTPAMQYKENTPETFKKLGSLTGQSPLKLQQLFQSITGGGFNQFTTGKAIEGRSKLSELPVTRRFYRSTIVNNNEEVKGVLDSIGAQNDQKYLLKQKAEKLYTQLKAMDPGEATDHARVLKANDPALYEVLKDVKDEADRGLTYTDRLVLQLNVQNGARAMYIYKKINELGSKEEKQAYYTDLRQKKVISDDVNEQLKVLLKK